jgi:predicted transcriptional regulator
MADSRFDLPATDEIELDEDTLAAIDRGIEDCENGRWVSLEDARKLLPQWNSKYPSEKPR